MSNDDLFISNNSKSMTIQLQKPAFLCIEDVYLEYFWYIFSDNICILAGLLLNLCLQFVWYLIITGASLLINKHFDKSG